MKKLMILGAGIYQVPLIKKAQSMGIYVIVTSIPGNYPGFEIADKVYYENTTDYEAILKIAREEKIDGIVTSGTDVAIITVGKVCDALGLPGLSAEAAAIATDKILMKEAYQANGVRTAKFRIVRYDDDNYADTLADFSMPMMVKAIDSSGSRGITRIDSLDEFEAARAAAKAVSRSDSFIVEEFIEGEECGAQAFVQDGKLEFCMPHGDYVFDGDVGVPIGHWAPYDAAPEVMEDMEKTLADAVRAMKLDNCAVNADFILKDGKPYVLEIGGRAGGTCLVELVSIYYGFDYYENMIKVAMGEHADFPTDQQNPCACHLIYSNVTGTLEAQTDENPANPDIVEVQFDRKLGTKVSAFKIGPHRIGHIITKGDTLDQAIATLDEARKHISITVAAE
ncbi:MAG: ATP-grasp domain-containing protein [Mogibacterium sp.]|nr:ATP-grasp domain-containing protein [Mogibacterium sp.]MBR2539213.1 ATP-grasp domain-containing protein [Mogibacterium sp.]